MDYSYFEDKFAGQKTKVGIIGATRGYGYTIVVQLLYTPQCSLRLICSRHPDECVDVLKKVGYNEKLIKVCETGDDVAACGPDDILVVSDYRLIVGAGLNTVVECTGKVDLSSSAAALAIRNGINVCMVSKETDSVCGPYLTKMAQENGVIYTLANGDQPRNLADLCSGAKALGLEIICAGKSSENDIIFNPETCEITYLEEKPSAIIPELRKYREFKGVETLKARYELLKSMLGPISADLCEMNLVSNVTGLKPAAVELNYPVARITELADIFIPEEDGGILKETGVVDVFYDYRYTDEVSFGGGEFVIVKCNDEQTWELLRGKGHVVGKSGKYACIYWPYHFLGVETPASILLMDFLGIGLHKACRQVSVMVGKVEVDMPAGSTLKVEGHHHTIENVTPQLYEKDKVPAGVLPFYLLNWGEVIADIKKGEFITEDKVRIDPALSDAYEFFTKGLEIK